MSEEKKLIAVAGETLSDLVFQADGLIAPKLGGSPYNFASALARLGRNTCYLNPLSTDYFGQEFAKQMEENGLKQVAQSVNLPTSLALVRIADDGQPTYSFYREGMADRSKSPAQVLADLPEQSQVFHVGSLALIPPDGQEWTEVLKTLSQRGITTSVDVNMRLIASQDHASYRDTIHALVPYASIIKVSDEDLHAIGKTKDAIEEAKSLINSNASTKIVVLTLGAEGAWAITKDAAQFCPGPKVKVVDTVGAGDCFYAGFICYLDENGLLDIAPTEAQLQEALQFASKVTSFNLQQQGCVPPWRHQVA